MWGSRTGCVLAAGMDLFFEFIVMKIALEEKVRDGEHAGDRGT